MTAQVSSKQGLGLTELIDKDLQKSMLVSALSRDRLGGTLLFFGPDGSGKSSLAFWLAAALNCLDNDGRGEPCGSCASCRKVEKLSHPDVIWVFPLPGDFFSRSSLDAEKLARVFEEKRSKPWLDIQFSSKAEHHLASVGRIREEAGKSRCEGRRKVFVITGADRLRIEAANAFLKLLEEPRPEVVLVLCSDRPGSLAPTILSRCQRLRLTRPGPSVAADLLVRRFDERPERALELLVMADGNLTAALRMLEPAAIEAGRTWVGKTLEAALAPNQEAGYKLLEDRKGPMYNRGDFERYAALLSLCLRDALVRSVAGKTEQNLLSNAGVESGLIEQFGARLSSSGGLLDLLDGLTSLQDDLNRNVNLRLLGWSIIEKLREVVTHESGNS